VSRAVFVGLDQAVKEMLALPEKLSRLGPNDSWHRDRHHRSSSDPVVARAVWGTLPQADFLHPKRNRLRLRIRPRLPSWPPGSPPRKPSLRLSAPASALNSAGRTSRSAARKAVNPLFILHGAAVELLKKRGARILLISLSHTQNHAAAVAILESEDRPPALARALHCQWTVKYG